MQGTPHLYYLVAHYAYKNNTLPFHLKIFKAMMRLIIRSVKLRCTVCLYSYQIIAVKYFKAKVLHIPGAYYYYYSSV